MAGEEGPANGVQECTDELQMEKIDFTYNLTISLLMYMDDSANDL